MRNMFKLTLLTTSLFFVFQTNASYQAYAVESHFKIDKSYAMGADFFSTNPAQIMLNGQHYTLSLTTKGIYLSQDLNGYRFLSYPENVQPNEVEHIHAEYVNGTPMLMLTVQNNRIYKLDLDLKSDTRIWRAIHVPNLNYGSYTINDFLSTQDGTYYLATNNGLYFHKSQPDSGHGQEQTINWKFKNNLPESNLTQLSWAKLIGGRGLKKLCAISDHYLDCSISGEWVYLSKPLNSSPYSHYNLTVQRELKASNSLNRKRALHVSQSTDAADVKKGLYISAHFAGGEPHDLYRNGNQQIPIYVDICPTDPGSSITDADLIKIRDNLKMFEYNHNALIPFNQMGTNGFKWTYERNNYVHGIFRQTSSLLNYQQTTCDNGTHPKTVVVYIQSISNTRAARVYASLKYTYNQSGEINTVTTRAASSNTQFNIHTPITLTKSDLHESSNNFYCPGGCTAFNDSATKHVLKSKSGYPAIYSSWGFYDTLEADFGWNGVYEAPAAKPDSNSRKTRLDFGPCLTNLGSHYSLDHDSSNANAIILFTYGCMNTILPIQRDARQNVTIRHVVDIYGNVTDQLNLGGYVSH